MECLINRVPSNSVHPKLKLTSSMYQKKIKFNQINKVMNPDIEMKSFSNLKQGLIEEVDNSCITKKEDYFNNSFKFDDDKIDNCKIESREHKNSQIDKINEIIDSLNNDTDLNILIDTINNVRIKENRPTFDKKNLNHSFGSLELDKFTQFKKMRPDFSVNISFQLIERDKD